MCAATRGRSGHSSEFILNVRELGPGWRTGWLGTAGKKVAQSAVYHDVRVRHEPS